MLILIPKCCSCKELSNDILSFGISSIQAKIKPKHQKYLHLILTEIVVLHFSDFHTLPPRGFLRTFFSGNKDMVRNQKLLSLLLLQFV